MWVRFIYLLIYGVTHHLHPVVRRFPEKHNNEVFTERRSACCLWALLSAEAYLPRRGAARREDQSSHYSYNEIIMNGAQRPHHKNIYCIIYSAGPLVQGERTHKNLQPCCSPPHSASCSKQSCTPSFSLSFSVFLFSLFVLLLVAQRASAESPRLFLQQQQLPASTNRKILPLCSVDADIMNSFGTIIIFELFPDGCRLSTLRSLWRRRKVTESDFTGLQKD